MQFSVRALVSAVMAAGLASAYTTPKGDSPEGNPISKPGLQDQVDIGAPEIITWHPTTKGTVTLVLLRGPSDNVKPLYPIAEKIPNTGTYRWTPSVELTPDKTHYGIQLIDDKTGQYQYSTQFGLKAKKEHGAVNHAGGPSPGPFPGTAGTAVTGTTITGTGSSGSASTATGCHWCPNVTSSGSGTAPTGSGTAGGVASSGVPHNSSVVHPTGPMTVPSTLRTASATATAATTVGAASGSSSAAKSTHTGAAGRMMANIGTAVVGAVGVAAVLI